jgi:HK97 family phage major capsid protein
MHTMSKPSAPRAQIKPGSRVERFLRVERAAVDEQARTVELAFASELPYERWWGVEVLDCSATSVRLQRLMSGAPLLWNHDTDEQIGVVESVSIGSDRVCRAVVRFGRSAEAEEIFADVLDGIRRNVSVGYLIHKAELVEVEGDPNDSSAAETYRVTDWEPYEVSLVSVPADPTVGVGRSAEDPRMPVPDVPAAPPAVDPVPSTRQEDRTMNIEAPALNTSEVAAAAAKAERARIAEIRQIGDQFTRFGGPKLALESIEAGETVDQFRGKLHNAIAAGQTERVAELGLSSREVREFSVMRAIRAMVDRDWRLAPAEKEMSDAICKRAGIEAPANGGFYVPYDVMAKRDLTVGTATAGGNMVGTNLMGGSFIELLRARSVVAALGATMMGGLVGNVAIPRQTGAATGYWLTNEATAITESDQTIGQLALSPKHVGAYTEVSRQLMMQATPAADQLVMNDFARVIALAIDLAALEGSAANGQPRGISNTSGIGSVSGTSLGYAGVVEFQTDVAGGNALVPGCAYVTTPAVAGLLMQRARFSNTDTPLWTGSVAEGQVGGYRAATTTQLTAASMIFGDFSQVVIGEWGLFELAMNPYANFTAAITGIRGIQSVDVGVRQAGAFSRATSIT